MQPRIASGAVADRHIGLALAEIGKLPCRRNREFDSRMLRVEPNQTREQPFHGKAGQGGDGETRARIGRGQFADRVGDNT